MNKATTRRGPWGHRFLILAFALGVSVLTFWLLGFFMNDVDRMERPSYEVIVTERLPAELVQRRDDLTTRVADNVRTTGELTRRRDLLRSNIDTSQKTINQLLELQRLKIEKDSIFSGDEQTALTENLELFLGQQKQSQELGDQIVSLNLEGESLAQQSREVEQKLEDAQEPLLEDYRLQLQKYDWKLAAIKLGILLPMLLVAGVMFWRSTGGTYAPLIYALSAALAGRVLLVMHEHFPAIYFRYLLIGTSLVIAIWVLVRLLRTVAHPAQTWLVKQYREAYAAFLCPVCEFPIRRGPLKFTAWTRRSLRKQTHSIPSADAAQGDVAYTCPCCATSLFERCEKCGETRHSLLPACEKCGDKKSMDAQA